MKNFVYSRVTHHLLYTILVVPSPIKNRQSILQNVITCARGISNNILLIFKWVGTTKTEIGMALFKNKSTCSAASFGSRILRNFNKTGTVLRSHLIWYNCITTYYSSIALKVDRSSLITFKVWSEDVKVFVIAQVNTKISLVETLSYLWGGIRTTLRSSALS